MLPEELVNERVLEGQLNVATGASADRHAGLHRFMD